MAHGWSQPDCRSSFVSNMEPLSLSLSLSLRYVEYMRIRTCRYISSCISIYQLDINGITIWNSTWNCEILQRAPRFAWLIASKLSRTIVHRFNFLTFHLFFSLLLKFGILLWNSMAERSILFSLFGMFVCVCWSEAICNTFVGNKFISWTPCPPAAEFSFN